MPIFVRPTAGQRRGKALISAVALEQVYRIVYHSGDDPETVAAAYSRDPNVAYAQPNYLRRYCVVPSDSSYPQQWGLEKIQAELAWERGVGREEILIAIVDSGIDYQHPDLRDNIWINPGEIPDNGVDDDGNGYRDDLIGWDFTDAPGLPGIDDYLERDNDPLDDLGHGTHVAGIAGARGNNQIGIAGVSWRCKLMALRAGFRLTVGAFLEDDDVAAAIVYAADNGADIINMSWGDPRLSPLLRDVIDYAYNRGCLLVAAAGNESTPSLFYPARYDKTIAVGATDEQDNKAGFSNYGVNLDLVAPGVSILSTIPGGNYGTMTGTSMAAPHVAGLAALLLSQDPHLGVEEIRAILQSSADDLGAAGRDDHYAAGRINAFQALQSEQRSQVIIHQPNSGGGVREEAAVVITAVSPQLDFYLLEWGIGSQPENWHVLAGPHQTPAVAEQVIWDTRALADSIYTLRLTLTTRDGTVLEDRVVVTVDHSPPLFQVPLQVIRRLDGAQYAYFLEWETDDASLGTILYRPLGTMDPMQSWRGELFASRHLFRIPDRLGYGTYQVQVQATNAAGLEQKSEPDTVAVVPLTSLRPGDWQPTQRLPAGFVLPRPVDLNGNGRMELVTMAYGDSLYEPVHLYEDAGEDSLKLVFTSADRFLPWDVGDVDGDGRMELLGGKLATTLVYASDTTAFPGRKVWQASAVWPSRFADLDRDGLTEIIARSDTLPEIVLFESRGDNQFNVVARLPNPTEGSNALGTQFGVGDFDGDGAVELIGGDSSGDLFAYEAVADNILLATWQTNLAPLDMRYLANGGDLDGDGLEEFVAAGNTTDRMDLQRNHWTLFVFEARGNDSYSPVWQIQLVGVERTGNGLTVADLNGDGRAELVFAALPDLYIIENTGDNQYQVVWHTTVQKTFNPFVGDLDGDGRPSLGIAQDDALLLYEQQGPRKRPFPPGQLQATPLGPEEIELRWNPVAGATSYRVYRQQASFAGDMPPDSAFTPIALVQEPFYQDTGLVKGTFYIYAVTAIDSSFAQQPESRLSQRALIRPDDPLKIVAVVPLSPRQVALWFNRPLASSARRPTHYAVAPVSSAAFNPGMPSSVILDESETRVLLGFSQDLSAGVQYTVQVSGVRDQGGIPLAANGTLARFLQPHLFPRLLAVESVNPTRLLLYFNKAMDSQSVEQTAHYHISNGIRIQTARQDAQQSERIHLFLAEETPLALATDFYFLTLSGLKDAEGVGLPTTKMAFQALAADLSQVVVYPNPYRAGGSQPVPLRFAHLPAQTMIRLYTLTGELVQVIQPPPGSGLAQWWGTNQREHPVASGVYLYQMESGGNRRTGKITLIR